MSQRLNEYFAREAAEYLDQLEKLLLLPREEPAAEQVLRLARGVRGSAHMAGAEGIVAVAERLEAAARGILSGALSWDEGIRTRSLRTVNDLKILMAGLGRWGAEEEARARSALLRWEDDPAEETHPSDENSGVVPIESLFFHDAGPHVFPAGAEGDSGAEPVPIQQLLFSGTSAARAALALRPRVEQAIAEGAAAELRPLVEELFDLLTLSVADSPPA